jgi:hypothetical protein
MELKGHFTTAIVVVYTILFISFIVYERKVYKNYREEIDEHECDSFNCISFCASEEKYTDEVLKKIYSNITQYNSDFFGDHSSSSSDIKIYRNNLKCGNFERKIIVEDLKNVRIDWVSVLLERLFAIHVLKTDFKSFLYF